jgi:hypothetical protein
MQLTGEVRGTPRGRRLLLWVCRRGVGGWKSELGICAEGCGLLVQTYLLGLDVTVLMLRVLRKLLKGSVDDVGYWCLCGEADTSFGMKQACRLTTFDQTTAITTRNFSQSYKTKAIITMRAYVYCRMFPFSSPTNLCVLYGQVPVPFIIKRSN